MQSDFPLAIKVKVKCDKSVFKFYEVKIVFKITPQVWT